MKCIIVDDEPLARVGLNMLLEEYQNIKIIGSFSKAAEALAFLVNKSVDLIFLDIRMPGINGIDFARSIRKNAMIIFITAHAEHALDSYEVEAIDYLVKPINRNRFHRAVNKAIEYSDLLKNNSVDSSVEFLNNYIMVRADRQFVKVDMSTILYIEGLKDYVIIFLVDGERILTNLNLRTIHNQLSSDYFIRVSKSYIVNISYISSFDNNMIKILDRDIPIGNIYRDEFLDKLVRKSHKK